MSSAKLLAIAAPVALGIVSIGLLTYRTRNSRSWLLKKYNCILITDSSFNNDNILIFQKQWNNLNKSKSDTINLIINSSGGHIWSAMVILQIIMRYIQTPVSNRAKIVTWVPYGAQSAAMLPLLASDEIHIHKNAVLGACDIQQYMVENPSVTVRAYIDSYSSSSSTLKTLKDRLNCENAKRLIKLDEKIALQLSTGRKWTPTQLSTMQHLFWNSDKWHYIPIQPQELKDALDGNGIQIVMLCDTLPEWVMKMI